MILIQVLLLFLNKPQYMNFIHTKNKNNKVIVIIMLLLPFWIFSQESNLGNWLIYIGNKKLDKGFNIHNEIQYRNYNAVGDLEQLLIRTGLGYDLSEKNNNILLGYGYILSKNYVEQMDDKISVEEHRIFQQFTTSQTIKNVGITHRYRIEERFVESDFAMRFRYFFGIKIPLQNEEKTKDMYYLSAYNEVFLNTEAAIFDRNRVYGSLGYQVSNELRFEVGYMNQIFENGSRDQINLMVFVTF